MASTRRGQLFISLFALWGLGACSAAKLPEVYLLTGNCKVEVSTPHDQAEILVDGILIGRGRVKTSIPCGQKQVKVRLKHHKPFEGIFAADAAKTLLVPVKLELLPKRENYALSDKMLQDIRAGKLAKGAVEGGASAPAAAGGGETGAVEAEINWDDWS